MPLLSALHRGVLSALHRCLLSALHRGVLTALHRSVLTALHRGVLSALQSRTPECNASAIGTALYRPHSVPRVCGIPTTFSTTRVWVILLTDVF